MEEILRQQWDKIRERILRRWGDRIPEDHLKEPMSYEDLCKVFGEHCDLRWKEARRELNRMLDETRFSHR